MSMILRKYTAEDFDACIALFKSNIPEFFSPEELDEYRKYLKAHDGGHLVIESPEGQLLATGGYYLRDGVGRLSNGLVAKDRHGEGIGRVLIEARLKALKEICKTIQIDTSQKTEGFYAKLGFKTTNREKNGFGSGLDSVSMELKL